MNEKDFYEVHVISAADIKAAYKYVVANNIKQYRCIAKNGTYYGFVNNKHVQAQNGQQWFDNPDYKPSDLLEDKETGKNAQEISLPDYSDISDQTMNLPKIVDYKTLYEAQCKILKTAQDAATNNLKAYTEVKAELDEIKAAFAIICKVFKSV